MLKRIIVIATALLIAVAMFAFAAANTGTIDVDLLFREVTTSIPLAFTVAFAAGWIFGLLSLSAWAMGLVRERRALKRALKVSESEVSSLRNLPLTDAD
jgi:uncharacterized integral membrane protein